ncbi:Fe-S cluster assembly iron-binding protein IscA [Nocardioides exalbidus]|uniref:Fe-S cluster assembly iron-binding protein IscA n=1 Tax=Nocardioides exalbidus TaxID=402596 RepID=A0A1H4YBI6_9ACTN|nr:hypothetical protein [Nocardioides exalbidus]SED14551.1 Fe-S cluster assembly iron-binding protein IscA [Nocardioides exalbidus]
MITMTSRARDVVRRITANPRIGHRSGLRIAGRESRAGRLSVRAVAAPEAGDRVAETDGARVYVDPEAEPRLDGHLLDAVAGEGDRVQFVMRNQR